MIDDINEKPIQPNFHPHESIPYTFGFFDGPITTEPCSCMPQPLIRDILRRKWPKHPLTGHQLRLYHRTSLTLISSPPPHANIQTFSLFLKTPVVIQNISTGLDKSIEGLQDLGFSPLAK
jgi:hypothetical protein